MIVRKRNAWFPFRERHPASSGDRTTGGLVAIVLLTLAVVFSAQRVPQPGRLVTGKTAMGDWTSDAIGSCSNDSDDASEMNRAHIFEFNPDGTDQKVYAWGIRNAVGIAFCPGTVSSRIQRRYLCRIPRPLESHRPHWL